ncbi:hypothetical protein RHMOL_RhmolUnG0006800 [Rhododendron molle]|nr:hypothetical protein RHMOL_RhmolUnG0006800 [Rhododendron molle]
MLPRSTEIQPCVAPIRPSPPPLSSFSKSEAEAHGKATTRVGARAQHEETRLFRWVARQKQWNWHGTTTCSKKRPKRPRQGKPIACHQARQGIAHGMRRPSAAKSWQADCFSPGKARHCSRHAKTKGGQAKTHGMPNQAVAKARLTAKP